MTNTKTVKKNYEHDVYTHQQTNRSINYQPGRISNQIITRRNGGVQHQFQNSIGGCSLNYR